MCRTLLSAHREPGLPRTDWTVTAEGLKTPEGLGACMHVGDTWKGGPTGVCRLPLS